MLLISGAIDKLAESISLRPLNDKQVPPKKKAHGLFYAGKFSNDEITLFRIKLTMDKSNSIKMDVGVRTKNETVRTELIEAFKHRSL